MPDSVKTKIISRRGPILELQGKNPGDSPKGKFKNVLRAEQKYQPSDPPTIPGGQNLPALPISRKGRKNNIDHFTELAKYFQQETVVVLVANGESREEAWHRHLLSRPQDARADVKIFHRTPKKF